MERHALPVRLVEAFNKVEKQGHCEEKYYQISPYLLQGIIMGGAPRAPKAVKGAAARRGGAPCAPKAVKGVAARRGGAPCASKAVKGVAARRLKILYIFLVKTVDTRLFL